MFAIKGTNNKDVFIYVFTNRKKLNNMQSPLEVEVWKLSNDNVLKLHAKRQYVHFFIKDEMGNQPPEEDKTAFYEFPNLTEEEAKEENMKD